MTRLLSIGIETFSSIIVLLPIMLILRYTVFKQHSTKKTILVFIYAVYLSAVFAVVGIPAINNLIVEVDFNFIPLIDSLNITSVLNILLFVPLGFLLPTIWSEWRSFKKTLLTGLGLSLAIEALQIFTFRLTDIDDLITNALGTILGYYLSIKLSEKLRLQLPPSNTKYEPLLVCLVVFLVMLTAQPLISDTVWDYILSSPLWEMIR